MSATPPIVPEETRMQVAVVAGAAERANRPLFLLVLAGVLVVVSMIFAGYKAAAFAGAREELAYRREQATVVADRVAQLRAAAAAQQVAALAPDPQVAGKLERLARDLGLDRTVIRQSEGPGSSAEYVRKRFDSTFRALDGAAVLEWVARATDPDDPRYAGVELAEIKLKPLHAVKDAGWDATVQFIRVEPRPRR